MKFRFVVRNNITDKVVAKFRNYSDMQIFLNAADPASILFYTEEY